MEYQLKKHENGRNVHIAARLVDARFNRIRQIYSNCRPFTYTISPREVTAGIHYQSEQRNVELFMFSHASMPALCVVSSHSPDEQTALKTLQEFIRNTDLREIHEENPYTTDFLDFCRDLETSINPKFIKHHDWR